MANTLTLEIVTPGAVVYSKSVQMVTLPAVEGQIGILPQHVPLLTRIVPGEIIVRRDVEAASLAVGGGPACTRACSAASCSGCSAARDRRRSRLRRPSHS